jgi:hypothetical protein
MMRYGLGSIRGRGSPTGNALRSLERTAMETAG